MKKIFLFLFLLFTCVNSFSQDNSTFCGVIETPDFIAHRLNILNNATVIDNPLTPLVLNVRINVFSDDQGNNFFNTHIPVIPFGEEESLDIIKMLNINYNQFNIYFKYLGYKFYDSSEITYYNNTNPTYYFNAMNAITENDAININFLQQCEVPTSPPTPTATHSFNYGGTLSGRTAIIVSMPAYYGIPAGDTPSYQNPTFDKDLMICHEMAHVLGLQHPYYNNGTCEHVERSGPYYNANIAGDGVDDTPAQRLNFSDKFQSGGPNDGKLIPVVGVNGQDCRGTTYDFEHTIYGNFVSMPFKYNPLYPTFYPINRDYYFTPGQGAFMRNYIQNPLIDEPGYSLIHVMNTVESLYQPYVRTNVPGETIVSTNDNGDGTAKVCRNILAEDKFQKGFTYNFPENDTPDTINASTEEIPVVSHHTYNYPVTIAQLAPGQTNLSTNTGYAELVCTRGVICNDEPYTNGIIYSSDSFLSLHVTIEELNAIQVKDPKQYENLLSQYYYMIKKETQSGAKTEERFYKQ